MDIPKILKKSIILNLLVFCFFSCTLLNTDEKLKCNNLFLVFMAGDNSLNKTVYTDLEELKIGLQTENDIILVLADRYSSNFYEDEWNEARLLEITYENGKLNVKELEDENIGVYLEWLDDSIDSGSEKTLRAFLQYAQSHYDSERVYLDLWNHGGGWKSGELYSKEKKSSARNICLDEETKNSLSLRQLSSAIKDSKIKHFEIILMDACSMASIEVAAELVGLTDTVIFSQDTIPEEGMPYNIIVQILFSELSTDEKCFHICDAYSKNYEKQKTTISSLKIDEDKGISNFLLFFDRYISKLSNLEEIRESRPYYYEFLYEVVDLSIFINEALQQEYNKILITNISDYSTGMSIYFPEYFDYSKDSWEYTSERLRFLEVCPSYLDFLLRIEKSNSSSTVIDSYEPNNSQIDSFILYETFDKIISYIWCITDEDWYVLKKTDGITKIKLTSPDFVEFNLQILLYKDGRLLDSIFVNKHNEVDISFYDTDEIYIKVYSTFGFYSQEEPYTIIFS